MRTLSKPPRMPVLLIASLGCCTTLAHAESIDALYEKAKLEKTLVLYGAGPSGSHDRWINDFQQRFPGVTVAFTGGLSNGLNQKIDQQVASRRMETDSGDLPDHPGFRQVEEGGRAHAVQARGRRDDRSGLQGRGRRVHRGQRQHHRLCLQHRSWCPPPRCRSPRSIFSNRGFEGQLITTDPTEDDAGLSVFNLIVEKYGWDYMDKYMAQKPAFVTTRPRRRCRTPSPRARSSRPSIPPRPRRGSRQQGKPIEPVFSQADPTPVFLVGAAIFKDAPHPNAAKLYLTWYLAKEQQSRNGTFSPRADVPPPAGLAPLSSYNIDNRFRALVSDESRG